MFLSQRWASKVDIYGWMMVDDVMMFISQNGSCEGTLKTSVLAGATWWNHLFLWGFPEKIPTYPNEYMPMPAFTHVATLTCHRTLLLDSPQACELAFRLGSCKRALAQISDPTWIQIRNTQMSMVRTPHCRWFCSKVLSAMDWMDCKMKHIEQRWIWSGDATNAQKIVKIAPACSLRAQINPTGKGTQDPRIPAETARLRTLRPSWSISVNSQPRCHSQRLRVNLRSSISSFVRKVDWGWDFTMLLCIFNMIQSPFLLFMVPAVEWWGCGSQHFLENWLRGHSCAVGLSLTRIFPNSWKM